MNPTLKAVGIDYNEIAELNRWLENLHQQESPADILTLCNIHRRLAKIHAHAADAALKIEPENPVPSDAESK